MAAPPQFDDLPFNSRPDLTPYLIHLTKNTMGENELDAFKNLVSILQDGQIEASTTKKGFIKGPNGAACLMDVPFQALKYVLTPENIDPQSPRYEPYGIILTKKTAYKRGCRPVLYLSNEEVKDLCIPSKELWRVVRLEVTSDGWISWLHEREWRCKGALKLPATIQAVLVRDTNEASRLSKILSKQADKLKCVPKSIIPLSVVSQGFLKA